MFCGSDREIDREFTLQEFRPRRRDGDDALAWVAAQIALLEEMPREGRAKLAADVMPTLGPVEAQPQQRPPALHGRPAIKPLAEAPFLPGGRKLWPVLADREPSRSDHPIEHRDAKAAGKVIVAEARFAERWIAMDPPRLPIRPIVERFDHFGDLARGEAVEAVAAAVFHADEAADDELREMRARRLRRRPGQKSQFAGRSCPAVAQAAQDLGAHGIAAKRAHRGERRR